MNNRNSIGDVVRYISKQPKLDQRLGVKKICQLIEQKPVTKENMQQVKVALEEEGAQAYKSGEYPVLSNLKDYKFLLYVDFSNNFSDYSMSKKSESDFMFQEECEQYQKAYKEYSLVNKRVLLKKRLDDLGVNVNVDNNMFYEDITGEQLFDLDDVIINIPEVNELLADGSYIINAGGIIRIYVLTRCAMQVALNNLKRMPYPIDPVFYKTFSGGTWEDGIQPPDFPPCEDIPLDCVFEEIEGVKTLVVGSSESFDILLGKGLIDKYNSLEDYKIFKYYFSSL